MKQPDDFWFREARRIQDATLPRAKPAESLSGSVQTIPDDSPRAVIRRELLELLCDQHWIIIRGDISEDTVQVIWDLLCEGLANDDDADGGGLLLTVTRKALEGK